MIKFKKGDSVRITSGKDKGREGKIEKIMPKTNKALIPNINIYKKDVKANLTVDGKGGVFELPRQLDFAKFRLICPNCTNQTRVGFIAVKGVNPRICRTGGKAI